ncbi:BatA domain-containing protein [Stieleria sp. TO1_6]|uniref:BatA domain-containing protein n=1 Tax=Stieleria tagensis TaxID=2956795 RepID=UPI00209B04BD|nr:BatA domain-containing protein [Stieleria tagensis]MCO8120155.1 BatA domain-containing protein [Stieleria tagensis]
MSFLRSAALWFLPLVLIPIVIHLIHRRRHPTMPWAAMMFLHRAAGSRRGPAKLRRWLILATRMLVVAALVFALARPLSSGAFGVAASRIGQGATSIVLLDRSPSMQRRVAANQTRMEVALQGVQQTIQTLGTDKIILIESVGQRPIPIDDLNSLPAAPVCSPSAARADIAEMFQTAVRYLQDQDRGPADIWICSDGQTGDWQPQSQRWQQVAMEAAGLGDAVSVHQLSFHPDDQINTSVQVDRVRWSRAGQGRAVLISITLERDDPTAVVVPVRVTVGAVTTTVDIAVADGVGELADYRIDVGQESDLVFGKVAIAADVNTADDISYFVAPTEVRPQLSLLTETRCDALEVAGEVFGTLVSEPANLAESQTQLFGDCLLWQGPLPAGRESESIKSYLDGGGQVVFFPPQQLIAETTFEGVGWGAWVDDNVQTASLDQLEFPIQRYCAVEGELVKLAEVGGQDVLIGKMRVGTGTAWFCGTDVSNPNSLFVKDGLALYGLLSQVLETERADAANSDAIAGLQATVAFQSDVAADPQILLGDANDLNITLERGFHAGVYQLADDGSGTPELLAINSPMEESLTEFLTADQRRELVPGLKWNEIINAGPDQNATTGFVREIWGAVWVLLILGMLSEAWLSFPRRNRSPA